MLRNIAFHDLFNFSFRSETFLVLKILLSKGTPIFANQWFLFLRILIKEVVNFLSTAPDMWFLNDVLQKPSLLASVPQLSYYCLMKTNITPLHPFPGPKICVVSVNSVSITALWSLSAQYHVHAFMNQLKFSLCCVIRNE